MLYLNASHNVWGLYFVSSFVEICPIYCVTIVRTVSSKTCDNKNKGTFSGDDIRRQ